MSTLNVSITEGVALLEFNRPKELNSFISQQYADIASTLEELTVEEKCVVAVLTGTGPYFTSGHFLGNFMQQSPEDGDLEKILKEVGLS